MISNTIHLFYWPVKQTSVASEALVLLTRRVAAAPTTVAATAIEDAVSTSPAEITFLITPPFLDLIEIEKSCPLWIE